MKTRTETWKWWDEKSGRPKKYDLAKLQSSNGRTVLTLYGGAGADALGEQHKKDAALIASAPELLAALKNFLTDEPSHETFKAARAAIAKATGSEA